MNERNPKFKEQLLGVSMGLGCKREKGEKCCQTHVEGFFHFPSSLLVDHILLKLTRKLKLIIAKKRVKKSKSIKMSVECFSLTIFNGFYARHGQERVLRFYDRQGEFVEAAAELFHALTRIESTVPRGIVYKILLLYQQNERQNCVLNGDGDTQEHVKISRSERRFFLSIFIFQRETQ